MEIEYNGEYIFNTNGIDKIPVRVNVMSSGSRLQDDKTVQITQNGSTTIEPDSTYDGMKKVTVETNVESNVKVQDSKEVTITQNGNDTVIPDTGYNGIASVFIKTEVPEPESEQDKTVTFEKNGQYTVIPTSPYNSMKNVVVNVNTPEYNIQSYKGATLTQNNVIVTIRPDAGYDALGSVGVMPKISAIKYDIDGVYNNNEYKKLSLDHISGTLSNTTTSNLWYMERKYVSIGTIFNGYALLIDYISSKSSRTVGRATILGYGNNAISIIAHDSVDNEYFVTYIKTIEYETGAFVYIGDNSCFTCKVLEPN